MGRLFPLSPSFISILAHSKNVDANLIVNFDSCGMSGHPNRKDVPHGICKLLHDNGQGKIEAWELISTNILRKYSGPVDIWLSSLSSTSCSKQSIHTLVNSSPEVFRPWLPIKANGCGLGDCCPILKLHIHKYASENVAFDGGQNKYFYQPEDFLFGVFLKRRINQFLELVCFKKLPCLLKQMLRVRLGRQYLLVRHILRCGMNTKTGLQEKLISRLTFRAHEEICRSRNLTKSIVGHRENQEFFYKIIIFDI